MSDESNEPLEARVSVQTALNMIGGIKRQGVIHPSDLDVLESLLTLALKTIDEEELTEFDSIMQGLTEAVAYAGGRREGSITHLPDTVNVRAIRAAR